MTFPWVPRIPPLAPGVIQVHRFTLAAPPARREALLALLTDDERQRASGYFFPVHQERFVVGRATLRLILSPHLGTQPSAVRLRVGPHGKPALHDDTALRFNLSHCEDCAVCAVTTGHDVGIDVEAVRERPLLHQVAQRFFSPVEAQEVLSAPAPAQLRRFLTCWTRKEAFIKACGGGLSIPLDGFQVTTQGPARLLATPWAPDEVERWSLMDVDVGPDHVAALAVGAGNHVVEQVRWEEPG
ncbi:MAG: 4'-phosphopantetheinyl transferase superfamily protein [Myxococcota bacterium]